MGKFKLVLYLSLSAILICVSAEESSPSNGTSTTTTTTSSPTSTTTTTTGAPTSTSTIAPVPVPTTNAAVPEITLTLTPLAAQPAPVKRRVEVPPTVSDFIVEMMKKFGAAKAAEAFQSLDQLPLGLIMKILLVEVDKQLASDIVAMQRYAQSADKSLIQMIGRIVAGDKNVPKEIFTMDQKLMKFPWWMRIRQRMFNNLEKYVAAYSLVPVAAKSATFAPVKSPSYGKELDALLQGPQPDLALAVAASATESFANAGKFKPMPDPVADTVPAASAPAPTSAPVPLQVSLLNPIQQQSILAQLAQAQAEADANLQAQRLFQLQQRQHIQQQQQQQAANSNPLGQFLQLFG